jgi:phage terminase small subunit
MSRSAKVEHSETGIHLSRLNVKQRAFVDNLLADPDFNMTRAAEAAGYSSPNVAAGKLMKNELVAKAVGHAMKKRSDRTEVTADRVIKELASIGFINIKQLLNDDGTFKPLQELPDEVAAGISSLTVKTSLDKEGQPVTEVDVDFYDKMDALQLLCKHLGMLDDRVNVSHDIGANTTDFMISMLQRIESGDQNGDIIDGNYIEGSVEP